MFLRAIVVCALASVVRPAEAAATRGGIGVGAGVSFFHKRMAFVFELEGYLAAAWPTETRSSGCGPAPSMASVGPMASVAFTRGGPRAVLGAVGGAGVGPPYTAVGGEVGAVYNAAGDRGVGLHLGADVSYTQLNVAVQTEAFREATALAGVRYLPPYGSQWDVCLDRA
jgi:hypothetical protein